MFNGAPFDSDQIGSFEGFVYMMTNRLTGKRYIGRKYFWSMKRQKIGRRKKVESDWKKYYSSSDRIKEEIDACGVDLFQRDIISLHDTQGQVNYFEVKWQFFYDVLEALDDQGERLFYNDNIASRYFVPKSLEHLYHKSDETRRKISDTHKKLGTKPPAYERSDELRARLSAAMQERLSQDNPRSAEKWTYRVLTKDGLREIPNFKGWFIEQGFTEKNLIALQSWSKKQKDRSFAPHAKVKKSDLHKKFHMKLLGYTDPDGTYHEWA